MTTPEQAQTQLAEAERLSKNAAGFSPHWITYAGLCGVGSTYAIATYYSGDNNQPVVTFSLISVIILVCAIGLWGYLQPAVRRGFGKRWGVMMAMWAAAWTATVNIHNNQLLAFTLAYIFLALAVVGSTWEAVAGKSAR